MRQRRLIGILVLLALIAGFMVYEGLIRYRPKKYFLKDPADTEARRNLVEKISDELEMWQDLDDPSLSAANDPDSLWPLDRLRIVKAIEEYRLQTGGLPNDLSVLEEAGLLEDPTVKERCRLVITGDTWEIRTYPADYLFAHGN